MANKLYAMEQLTEEVAKDVAASPQEWMRFLNTASRLYKYTFPEQLLIYAQRPEATAVASMEIWNQKMYRWIKKGSKGIALIDNTSGPKTKLRYVFDVQDTYKVRNLGKDPQLWNLPVEGEQLVADYLQEQLSLEDIEGGLAEGEYAGMASRCIGRTETGCNRDIFGRTGRTESGSRIPGTDDQ